MKKSQIEQPISLSPQPPTPRGPRYRYFLEPPETVALKLGDLERVVEKGLLAEGFDASRVVELPAAEALQGLVPGISLKRLAELAPGCFRQPEGDVRVPLPVAPLARVYQLVARQEIIEEAPLPPMEEAVPVEELKAEELKKEEAKGEAPKEEAKEGGAKEEAKPEVVKNDAPVAGDVVGKMPEPPAKEETKGEADLKEAGTEKKEEAKPESVKPEVVKDDAPATGDALAGKMPEPLPIVEKGQPAKEETKGGTDLKEEGAEKKEEEKPESVKPEVVKDDAPVTGDALAGKMSEPPPGVEKGLPAKEETKGEAEKKEAAKEEEKRQEKGEEAAEKIVAEKKAHVHASTSQHPPIKRLFSMMPIFRRKVSHQPPPVVSKPAPVPEKPTRRPRVELPPPKIFIAPPAPLVEEKVTAPVEPPAPAVAVPEASSPPVTEPVVEEKRSVESAMPAPAPVPQEAAGQAERKEEKPAEKRSEEPPVVEVPAAKEERVEAAVMEAEPVVLKKKQPLSQPLSNQDDLQALFLTEELLTVERVIELCGGLPGVKSCVLSHGSAVIASHNVPDTIDLVSLSAHAVEMLHAMRESAAKMGVGAVPAVTIHSEKGPITFFHQDDICLLVLHKDRGFVPGVREKLQGVMDCLAEARLPRPLPQKPRFLEG